MKTRSIIFFSVLVFFLSSCGKEDESPPSEFTLGSEPFKGFLFESLSIIDYDNASATKPDFVVLAQVNAQGDVLAPFLSHPDYQNRFAFLKDFTDPEEALEYYEDYTTPENKDLQVGAFGIKPNQVWLIKTNSGGFGKILVLSTRVGKIDETAFAEITFKAGRL
jgi:hypothetical protein